MKLAVNPEKVLYVHTTDAEGILLDKIAVSVSPDQTDVEVSEKIVGYLANKYKADVVN